MPEIPPKPGIPSIPGMPSIPGIPGRLQDQAARAKAGLDAAKQKAEQAAAAARKAAEGKLKEAQEPAVGTGPVGSGEHAVQKGECISSIARDSGHFWKTIWEDPANSELREVRQDPNLLLPGDRVSIPEKRPKQESGATELRHRFVRKGEPAHLRMRILVEDEPVANAPYLLTIDGQQQEGTTDADGWVQAAIPGNARGGELVVESVDRTLTFPLNLGAVPPVTEISGIQARLSNLGFLAGALDGVLGPKTKAAIRLFQVASGHPNPTGEPDEQTRALLKQQHGS